MEVESRDHAVQPSDVGLPSPAPLGPYIQGPVVGNLNVSDQSTVHLGPKVYQVTQHVTHKEVVRGRLLRLDLESSLPRSRFRCSVIVFVCWASIVTCVVSALLVYFLLARQKRLDIGLRDAWYLRRDDWQAMEPYNVRFLELPMRHVVVGHSATTFCHSRYTCIKSVLAIQQDHLRREFEDIGPNYLLGGGGLLFEGRGANVEGAMVGSWNHKIISVMFLGDYIEDVPDEEQLHHLKLLLDMLLREGVLTTDFDILGKCQINTWTHTPGPNLMRELRQFSNWNPRNASCCIGAHRSSTSISGS